MSTHFVLLDYENIACSDVKLSDEIYTLKELIKLQSQNIKLFIFTTSSQLKISLDVAEELFKLDHEYMKIKKVGSNALNAADFCIARKLGELEATYRESNFYVFSKDKGFDSLVEHCNEYKKNGNVVFRIECLTDLMNVINILQDQKSLKEVFKSEKVRDIVLHKFLRKSYSTQSQLNMAVAQQVSQSIGTVLSADERLKIFRYCVERGLAKVLKNNKLDYSSTTEECAQVVENARQTTHLKKNVTKTDKNGKGGEKQKQIKSKKENIEESEKLLATLQQNKTNLEPTEKQSAEKEVLLTVLDELYLGN